MPYDLNRIWDLEVSIIDVINDSDKTYNYHMERGNLEAAAAMERARLADWSPIPFDKEPEPPPWPCLVDHAVEAWHERDMSYDGWIHGDPDQFEDGA